MKNLDSGDLVLSPIWPLIIRAPCEIIGHINHFKYVLLPHPLNYGHLEIHFFSVVTMLINEVILSMHHLLTR